MPLPKRLPFFNTHTLKVQQKEHWIRSQKTSASVLVQSLSISCVVLVCQLIFLNLSFLAYKVGIKKVVTQYTKTTCYYKTRWF